MKHQCESESEFFLTWRSADSLSARRSSISVAVAGFWWRFEPAGWHGVSFSLELCSLNRKKSGSKKRAALAPDPPKTFSDMEMCTRLSVSAKNEIMSGSCQSWTQTEEITVTMWTQPSMAQTFATIFQDAAITEAVMKHNRWSQMSPLLDTQVISTKYLVIYAVQWRKIMHSICTVQLMRSFVWAWQNRWAQFQVKLNVSAVKRDIWINHG